MTAQSRLIAKIRVFLYILALSSYANLANSQSSEVSSASSSKSMTPSASTATYAVNSIQDVASLLAGKDLPQGTPASLKNNPAWQVYSKEVKVNWDHYSKVIGQPMLSWSKTQITQSPQNGSTVVYPFSGPDFTTLYQLYPDAGRYVMMAMQRAEKPVNLSALNPAATNQTLEVLTSAWHLFDKDGFFVTEYLDKYLYKNHVRIGASTFLATFLNLQGFMIDSVLPIQVNDRGEVEELPTDSKEWKSVRFKVRKNGKSVILDYLSVDLSNKGFESNPQTLKFIKTLSVYPFVFKAASHLPQNKEFNVIVDEIIQRAPSVVQDETGIKYTLLTQKYDVALFGKFEKTHHLFKSYHTDLAKAFAQRTDIKPLPFRVGYFKGGNYALMIANRKK